MDVRHLGGDQLPDGHLHLVLAVRQRHRFADELAPRARHLFQQLQRGGQIVVFEIEGDRQRLRHPVLGVRVEQLVQLVLLRIALAEQAGPALLRVLGEELRRGQATGGAGGGVGRDGRIVAGVVRVVRVLGGGGLEQFGRSLAGGLRTKRILRVGFGLGDGCGSDLRMRRPSAERVRSVAASPCLLGGLGRKRDYESGHDLHRTHCRVCASKRAH